MGLRGKVFGRNGGNAKVLPALDTMKRSNSWDSEDSVSTGVPTPCSETMTPSSCVSTRTNSRGSSVLHTPRTPSQRRRPLVDVLPVACPTSSGRRSRSSVQTPVSPWTQGAPFEREKVSRRAHQLSHLIAPVQPWNEFIEGYAKNLVEKVGGTFEAWIDVMSLKTTEVRQALTLSMMTPRGSNKPRPLPENISKAVNALLESLPPAYRNNFAKLNFALHERPFYCTALEKHVELVIWGVAASRNEWM